jgi:hypothetical protein
MKDLEKIIRYLDGEMNGEEKQLFEQELVGDKSLKQSTLLMEEIDRAIHDDEVFAFQAKLKETQELYNAINKQDYVVDADSPKEISEKSRINWKYALSAAISLLIVVSTIWINFSQSSNDKIFASYYHRYEANYEGNEVNNRAAGVSHLSLLINAVQLYDQGNFTSALKQFDEIIKIDADNLVAHFFIGLVSIENKNYDKAIENLLYVINKKDVAYVEHSEWYLALCYLKKDQTAQALTVLTRIANSNSYYKSKALDLLKKLQ